MNRIAIIILAFTLFNVIPYKSSWRADCVWCASQHDQPLYFEGHTVGLPFAWRSYGVEHYDYGETKFAITNHPALLLWNVLFLGGILSGVSLLSSRFRGSNNSRKDT